MKVSVGVFTYRSMMIVMLMMIIIIIILYHLYHSNSHNLSLVCFQQRSSSLSLISPLCYYNHHPMYHIKVILWVTITFNRRKYHCFQGSSFNVDPFVSVAEATNTGNCYYVCIPHHRHYYHQYHHHHHTCHHHHHLYQHLHYHHHTDTHHLQYSAVISLTIIIIIASLFSSSFSSS